MNAGLFPGQGIEPAVVAAALPDNHPRLDRANTVLGYDVKHKVVQVARRSRPVLATDLAQPAIFLAGVIAFEKAIEDGVRFDYLEGHSLGEYTALVAAGSIPFTHGLKLVAARGTAMQRAAGLTSGCMAAVIGLPTDQLENVCHEAGVTFANDNSPSQGVISGDEANVAGAAALVRELGGRTVLLPVDGAYHSAAMGIAEAQLTLALEETDVRNPKIPVVSNISALPYRAPGEIRKLLLAQLTSKVRFRESIAWLVTHGVDEFIDLGPGRIVGRLAQQTARSQEEAA